MNQVVESAYKVLNGELKGPEHAGYCLQLVRLIVEDAYRMKPYSFYDWRTHPVERDQFDSQEPWARDMERSLRAAGMAISFSDERYISQKDILERCESGSLLFRWDTAKSAYGTFIGHVGILMPGGMVLENVNPVHRMNSFFLGVTALTPLKYFRVTTAIWFDPTKGERNA